MRSSVAGEYTIKVLYNKWVLQTADRPRDVSLVEAAEELTAVCNTPSFYSYLLYPGYQSLEYSIESWETHRFDGNSSIWNHIDLTINSSIWWNCIDLKSHRFDKNSSIWNHIDLKTNWHDSIPRILCIHRTMVNSSIWWKLIDMKSHRFEIKINTIPYELLDSKQKLFEPIEC